MYFVRYVVKKIKGKKYKEASVRKFLPKMEYNTPALPIINCFIKPPLNFNQAHQYLSTPLPRQQNNNEQKWQLYPIIIFVSRI